MKKKPQHIVLFFVILMGLSVKGQIYNNTNFSVTKGAVLSVVNGTLRNDFTGDIQNDGNITVGKNIENFGLITGRSEAFSEFNLQENWVNDGTFTADSSTVRFFGGDQFIDGSSISTFYNLELTNSGRKIQRINARTSLLDLTTVELATDGFTMEVLSFDPAAILRSNGFVSSLNNGHLLRNTNTQNTYLFPTGSSLSGIAFYRPIEITPNAVTPSNYGVRLAENNATTDGYDLGIKESNVKQLNDNYYHHLYKSAGGASADVTFFYLPIDGEYENVGHWTLNNIWTANFNEQLGFGGFNEVTAQNVTNFNTKAFILANKVEPIYIQNAFSPNGDNINDVFELALNDEDFEEFSFTIFNRWGEVLLNQELTTFSWDGDYKGNSSPIGVYPWIMSYRFKGDIEVQTVRGHLNLIR